MATIRTLYTIAEDDVSPLLTRIVSYISEQYSLRRSRGTILYIDSTAQSFLTAFLASTALVGEDIVGYISTEHPGRVPAAIETADTFNIQYALLDPTGMADSITDTPINTMMPLSDGSSEEDLYDEEEDANTFNPTPSIMQLFLHSREFLLKYLTVGSVTLTELMLAIEDRNSPAIGTINPLGSMFSSIEVSHIVDTLIGGERITEFKPNPGTVAYEAAFGTIHVAETNIISNLCGEESMFLNPLGKLRQRVSAPSRLRLGLPCPWRR